MDFKKYSIFIYLFIPNIQNQSRMDQESSSLTKPLNVSIKESVQVENSLYKPSKLTPERASVNDVFTESILTVDLEVFMALKKRYKRITIVSIVFILIGVFMIAAMPQIMHSLIKSNVIDTVVFTSENEGLWAHFPGDSETYITRNYTFFNFTNPQEVLLFNQKPKFREISGYIIGQYEDFLNITYSEDGNIAKFRDWMHFVQRDESRNLQQKVKILNIGKLGYWYQLKNAQAPKLLQQGLATLFSNLQISILDTVYAQGIWAQFLKNPELAKTTLFIPAGILDSASQQFLWKDFRYGMNNMNNLRYWVQAANNSTKDGKFSFSIDALNMQDYFTLSDTQMLTLLLKYKQMIQGLEPIIRNNYCSEVESCTGRYMTIEQMRRSWVTKFPPPPVQDIIIPADTICVANLTCTGLFPELDAYYKNVFLQQHPEKPRNISFDFETVLRWFDYNNTSQNVIPKLTYNTAQDCLLHIGNLEFLWETGSLYDATGDDKYVNMITSRFGLKGKPDFEVFWQWIKYFYAQVIKQKGTNQHVGISTLFVQGLYGDFSKAQDTLQHFLLTKIITSSTSEITCKDLLLSSFQSQSQQDINKVDFLCSKFANNHQQLIQKLINACRNKDQNQYIELKKAYGVSFVQLESLCDSQIQFGFGQFYHNARFYLNDFYQCNQTPSPYCSDFQIAAKQWANSTITNKLVPAIKNKYTPGNSLSIWMPQTFKPFEYGYFFRKFQRMFPIIKTEEVFRMMNFQSWFSSFKIQSLYMNQSTVPQLRQYIRYATIFVAMEGFTMQAKVKQLMFGYKDQFLDKIRKTYPPFGGDPSVMSTFLFNDPNITKEETFLEIQLQTGKADYKRLGLFKTVNGMDYMTINQTTFNGNQTKSQWVSPWKVNDKIIGTNAKFFGPDQPTGSQDIQIYIPNLQRGGGGNDTFPYERYGFNVRKAVLPNYIYQNTQMRPENDKYYQKFYAVFNQTSVVGGVPFFVTKNHFMNCSSNWSSFVDIYNEDQSIHYKETSEWDQSFVILQPHSGAAFQATIYLQTNFYYQPDELFRYNQTSLLPTFTIYRSGNITEESVNKYFGQLATALTAIIVVKIIGAILGTGFLVLAGFAIYKLHLINLAMLKQEQQHDQNKKFDVSLQNKNKSKDQQPNMARVDQQ